MHICPGTLLHKGPIANACVAKGPKAEEEELLHNGDITHKTLFLQNGINQGGIELLKPFKPGLGKKIFGLYGLGKNYSKIW